MRFSLRVRSERFISSHVDLESGRPRFRERPAFQTKPCRSGVWPLNLFERPAFQSGTQTEPFRFKVLVLLTVHHFGRLSQRITVHHFLFTFADSPPIFSLEEMARPRKDEGYEPKIRTMFRFPKELNKRLKTAVRRKKAKSANAYVEMALSAQLDKDGIK